ncbi:MAG: M23 family metallopeptidase [Leeuwenhoekiella sp.]
MKTDQIQRLLLLLLLGLTINSCKQLTKAKDFITQPTAREKYERDFTGDPVQFKIWKQEFERALGDSTAAILPYTEQGFFGNQPWAYSYILPLQQGEIAHFNIDTDSITAPIFLELFQMEGDSVPTYTSVLANDKAEHQLAYTVEKTGNYKLVFQPGINLQTSFNFSAFSEPLYHFPVSGKSSKAIQSYWGASRDGGRRSHKGVDIFAPRGTPVVAATDGFVSSTGNRGLGGKQVWLRSGIFGNSLYYAHLDSIIAQRGQRVRTGDTLGLVGNTGNARTTPPHLHFGIYQNRRGAIDPFPYIKETDLPKPSETLINIKTSRLVIQAARANLRSAASLQALKIGEAQNRDTLFLLGQSDRWMHVRTQDSLSAFVHESLVQPVGN